MRNILIFLWAILFAVSCGGAGGAGGGGGQATELEGTWKVPCDGNEIYTFSFSGSQLASSYQAFSGGNCQSLDSTLEVTATFAIGDSLSSPSGAKKLDVVQVSRTLTPNTAAAAAAANGQARCGYTDWQAGVPKDIAGKNCSDGKKYPNGVTIYTIFKLDTASFSARLFFGTSDGFTEETRPTALGSDAAVKQ